MPNETISVGPQRTEHLEQLGRWFTESYDFLVLHASEVLPDIRFIEPAISGIDLSKCPAQSKTQFIRWTQQQIAAYADTLPAFAQLGQTPSVADVLTLAQTLKKAKDLPPFPPYETQNGIATIHFTGKTGKESIIRVPAVADCDDPCLNFLPILQALWPWYERDGRLYKYGKRYDARTMRRSPKDLTVSHVYLRFRHPAVGDDAFVTSRARNGDFLDYTNDNLYLPSTAENDLPVSDARAGYLASLDLKDALWKWKYFRGDRYIRVRTGIPVEQQRHWYTHAAKSMTLFQDAQHDFENTFEQMPSYQNDNGEAMEVEFGVDAVASITERSL